MMQLYAGLAERFVRDASGTGLSDKLRHSFYDYYGHQPTHSELMSWQNSLGAMALQLVAGRLLDTGIIVEMELPLSSSRLDVLVLGQNGRSKASGVVVELKQWQNVKPAEIDDCVRTAVGGGERDVPHPSRQAANYVRYLSDANSAYGENGIWLSPCAFLHNMRQRDAKALYDPAFAELLNESPVYVGAETDEFIDYLRSRVGAGSGGAVLEQALSGTMRPARKLLQHTSAMIAGEQRYTLLDEQIVAYQRVLGEIRRAGRRKHDHSVVVVKGGPGSGKSVIALNLVGTLSKLGFATVHATGSKSFTETLWKVLGRRAKPQFRYFNSFGQVPEGELDVLVLDEAHRIRKSSNSWFTAAARRSDLPQVEELIRAAKVSAFFVDDFQAVRPNEIGSAHYIREAAVALGAGYHEIDLRAQFRCAGSQTYLDWVDQLLEVKKTGTAVLPVDEPFAFKIVDSIEELDEKIERRSLEGENARLVAGYCWSWSDPDSDGQLIPDVQIGAFRRPWNAKLGAKTAREIPPASLWASDPGGRSQIGCVYTAQGFEFDYVGVIFGRDLVVRNGNWTAVRSESKDPGLTRGTSDEALLNHLKNTYRVLLSRGLKGAYVYFLDCETEQFVRSRIAGNSTAGMR